MEFRCPNADHWSVRTLRRTLIVFGLTFTALQLCTAQTRPVSINRSEYVPVNSQKLYLVIRSADRKLPILLWVHGGPGGAERPLFRYFNSELERHFTVVYWDQRGAGRSFDPKADRLGLTIARHLADLNAIIDHLRSTLRPAKVLLVGHSWGAALSIFYAGAHPHKVSAVFAANPLVSVREQRQVEYKFVLAESAQRHDDEVLHATHKRIHSRLRGYALQDHWDHLLAMALQIDVAASKTDRGCENAPFYRGAVEGGGRA